LYLHADYQSSVAASMKTDALGNDMEIEIFERVFETSGLRRGGPATRELMG
jgi:hypothetical protein